MSLVAESYLKSGSNELRMLEYTVCGHSYGINILKVQKILTDPGCLTSVMNTHPSVMGIFKDNGEVIPLIDLGHFLGFEQAEKKRNKKVVVTEFFGSLNAFMVDSVEWIHHFNWEDVINANDIMKSVNQKFIISIVKPDGKRMVPLLDYETIILDICPELTVKEIQNMSIEKFDAEGMKLLIAEDSPSVRNMLSAELSEFGYDVEVAYDGKQAYDMLLKDKTFKIVVSDVEMPQMDGLALLTQIRSNKDLKDMPVIVYSSIGDMGMKARAEFLQADAHVTKLSIEELLTKLAELSGKGKVTIKKNEEPVAINSESKPEPEPVLVAQSSGSDDAITDGLAEQLSTSVESIKDITSDSIVDDTLEAEEKVQVETGIETKRKDYISSSEVETDEFLTQLGKDVAVAAHQNVVEPLNDDEKQVEDEPFAIIEEKTVLSTKKLTADKEEDDDKTKIQANIIPDAKSITISNADKVTILNAKSVTMINDDE